MTNKSTTLVRMKFNTHKEMIEQKREMEKQLGFKISTPEFLSITFKRQKKKERKESEALFSI